MEFTMVESFGWINVRNLIPAENNAGTGTKLNIAKSEN
jgi:hypothetical protein